MIDVEDYLDILKSKLDNVDFKKRVLGYDEKEVLDFFADMCESFHDILNETNQENENLKEQVNKLKRNNKKLREENEKITDEIKSAPYRIQALAAERDKYRAMCETYETKLKK